MTPAAGNSINFPTALFFFLLYRKNLYIMTRRFFLFSTLLTLLFTACSQQSEDEDEESTGRITFFSDSGTRGSRVTSISSFGVTASAYATGSSYAAEQCGNYFYCQNVTSGTATTYYWPPTVKKMAFYAYYPYDNANLTVSAATTVGRPVYSYTVPQAIASQVDVMTAEVTDRLSSDQSAVALTFGHRCCELRFKVYNQQSASLTVKSISVYGVKYSGTYTSGTSWSLSGSVNSSSSHPFTLTTNTSVTSGATVDITSATNHFIMLPQRVAASTEFIVVKTQEDGAERTYSYTLPSYLDLNMGTSYEYLLTLGNGELTVSNTSVVNWQAVTTATSTFSTTTWTAQ